MCASPTTSRRPTWAASPQFVFQQLYDRLQWDITEGEDSPPTMDEEQSTIDAEGRPDLSFLKERPSFMQDSSGVTKAAGQPDHPWN